MTVAHPFSAWYSSLWGLRGKESACQCRRCGFSPWVRKMPWRRKWQPTPVFLPGESRGQRSLAGYTVHGVAKSQTRLSAYACTHTHTHRGPGESPVKPGPLLWAPLTSGGHTLGCKNGMTGRTAAATRPCGVEGIW